ncbi:50S ribosomal protein L21 [Dehalobacter sp. DCM]|uniref:50S ribosomal protein L21 n=1 Tax=Dehalobacter sp. DCM TaxID=2907827 RepID=UPI003081C141|nr:50S ribosomal protein L21 [Dehalobacter sp. DCM]
MYAIIETGGKQYRVQEGEVLNVEKLDVAAGQVLDINKVLLVEKDGTITVGSPMIDGVTVAVKVVEHGKGDKVIAFRYKPKKHVRVKKGHRQPYTKIAIEKINA